MQTTKEPISRAAWLERRRKYLGGSDAAPALGLSPYKSPFDLYQDKLGLSQEPTKEVMERGLILEPLVMRLYERAVGYEVQEGGHLISKEHDFMAATPDGIDGEINSPLQGKTVNWWGRHKWGEEGSRVVPVDIFLQCQHEMAVMGVKRNRLVTLFADTDIFRALVHMVKAGMGLDVVADFVEERSADDRTPVDFLQFPVERDESVIADLVTGEHRFWHEHVLKQVPPADVKAPEKKKTYLDADDKTRPLMKAVMDAQLASKIAKQGYDEAKEPLKVAIGDFSGIIDPDLGKVNFKAGPPHKVTDTGGVILEFAQAHKAKHDAAVKAARTIVNDDAVLLSFKTLDAEGYAAAIEKHSRIERRARSMVPCRKKGKAIKK